MHPRRPAHKKAQFAARFGISTNQARRFQCTAEHLLARQDGGTNHAANIAAACLHCNRRRRRHFKFKDCKAYRRYVQARVAAGTWHPSWVYESGIVRTRANPTGTLRTASATLAPLPRRSSRQWACRTERGGAWTVRPSHFLGMPGLANGYKE
ncbi:HNH endonuclease [Lysobacter niabensis]|uniref:HNH endonuclease n=1 Tax=Agrilutibacter niabensis TaxID=380628 RepID=UPI00360B52D6